MSERRTRVVLEAEAKGFAAAEKAASKVKSALDVGPQAKTFAAADKAVVGLGGSLARIAVAAAKLKDGLDLKDQTKEVQALARAFRDAANEMDGLGQKKRGFMRGMAQGAGIGEYFPEGDNLGRNIAGRAVGSVAGGAARGAGGAASSVWTGAQGVLQGLAGIPMVGGMLSGGMGAALGMTGDYLSYASARQSAETYGRLDTSGTRARSPRTLAAQAAAAVEDATWGDMPHLGYAVSPVNRNAIPKGMRGMTLIDPQGDLRAAEAAAVAAAEKSEPKGPSRADITSRFGGEGIKFGMDLPTSMQFAQSLAQSAGGTLQDISTSSFRNAAAAQARFGIGAGVSGAYERGGRIGGSQNGGFAQDMERALRRGLEGSDLERYMETMAGTLSQFESTGMPLDLAGFGAAQSTFAGMFGGIRGGAVANGFLQAGRGMVSNGASNATQFQMLRDVYGYGGGGTDDYFEAIKRAESGKMGDVSGFMENMMAGGTSKSSKALILMARLKSGLGVSIGTGEAERIAGGDMAAFQSVLDTAAKRTQGFNLGDEGEGAVDGNLRRVAGQRNKKIGIGGKLVGAALDFEDASNNAAASMSNFNVALATIAKIAKDGSVDLEKMFAIIGGYVNGFVSGGKE